MVSPFWFTSLSAGGLGRGFVVPLLTRVAYSAEVPPLAGLHMESPSVPLMDAVGSSGSSILHESLRVLLELFCLLGAGSVWAQCKQETSPAIAFIFNGS